MGQGLAFTLSLPDWRCVAGRGMRASTLDKLGGGMVRPRANLGRRKKRPSKEFRNIVARQSLESDLVDALSFLKHGDRAKSAHRARRAPR